MIVHQVWIGTKPAPEEWMSTVESFCKSYGYTYMRWGNEEIQKLPIHKYHGIPQLLQEYLENETQYKYAGLVDIYRTILLYEYGGVYLDSDMIILRPREFHTFLENHKEALFYGWETNNTLIANSVIGCPKGHPYMKLCLDELPFHADRFAEKPVWDRSGPGFVTHMYNRYGNLYENEIVILPQTVFFPGGWHETRDKNAHTTRKFPKESLLFQYGYTTNSMEDQFKKKEGDFSGASVLFVAGLFVLSYYVTKRR